MVRMPFWMDSSSEGSPSEDHWVVSTSLVNRVSSLNQGWGRKEQGVSKENSA
jgi:hypothetical protein